jgi:hypothetical protein
VPGGPVFEELVDLGCPILPASLLPALLCAHLRVVFREIGKLQIQLLAESSLEIGEAIQGRVQVFLDLKIALILMLHQMGLESINCRR